jgi:hypothetical protein
VEPQDVEALGEQLFDCPYPEGFVVHGFVQGAIVTLD